MSKLRNPKANMQKIDVFTGVLSTVNFSATTSVTLQLNPLALDARLLAHSDLYMNYRFTAVTVQVFRRDNNLPGTYPICLGFNTGVATVAPASQNEVMDCSVSSIGIGQYGSPWPKLLLNKKKLFQAAPKWFRRGTPYDDLLEVQGQIFMLSLNGTFEASQLYYTVRYVVEFCNPLDAADTVRAPLKDPQFDALLKSLREREEKKAQDTIVKVESFVPSPTVDPVLDKIRDLLLRDQMVIVNQGEDKVP